MPHFGHVIVLAVVDGMNNVLAEMVTDFLAMSSRSGIGRRDTYWRVDCLVAGVATEVHTVPDIDPDDPMNISLWLAFDRTQAAPQSFWLNDTASENM